MEMIFRIGIAILQYCKEDLLQHDMEGMLRVRMFYFFNSENNIYYLEIRLDASTSLSLIFIFYLFLISAFDMLLVFLEYCHIFEIGI